MLHWLKFIMTQVFCHLCLLGNFADASFSDSQNSICSTVMHTQLYPTFFQRTCVRRVTIRMWMRTLRPRLLCSRWWQWWRSKAKWRPGTWTGAPQVGYELPWRQRGRWPTSWTESDRCCSRRWETSPWRHPSSPESRKTGQGQDPHHYHACSEDSLWSAAT